MLVESKVDYDKSQNLILTCVVLVIGISGATIQIGEIALTGMGLATVVAMVLSLFFKLCHPEVRQKSNFGDVFVVEYDANLPSTLTFRNVRISTCTKSGDCH